MNDSTHSIISVFIALARFYSAVDDTFFRRRLENKMSLLLESYLERSHVAQYGGRQKHLLVVESLIELIEEMDHFNIGDSTPLSFTLDSLLRYKLQLLKSLSLTVDVLPPKDIKEDRPGLKAKTQKDPSTKISLTGDKIYQFIKNAPNTRTKDIIDKFNNLSERTVKRNLKELTHLGLIEKRSENRAVFYSSKGS